MYSIWSIWSVTL